MTSIALALVLLTTGLWGALREAQAGSVDAGDIQVARNSHLAISLPDGDVLLIGNASPYGDSNAADRYDVQTNTWTAAARYFDWFSLAATVLASGKVVVAGYYSNQLTQYDPVADTWTTLGTTYRAHAWPAIFEYAPQKVLIVGGEQPGGYVRPEVDTFDIGTGLRGSGNALLTPRSGQISARLPDGRIMVAGGYHQDLFGSTVLVTTSEVYDPSSGIFGTWLATGSLGVARVGAQVVTLADGRILAIGGDLGQGRTTEIFDPATMTWSSAASMLKRRHYFTATRLADGKVLVIGGAARIYNELADVEVYDPAANRWSWSVPLPAPRSHHTATLLPSGEVLVAGGVSGIEGYLATSLRYTPEDNDSDDDLVQDQLDNCPNDPNVDQANLDSDPLGDVCDPDDDGDDASDLADNCPRHQNADQEDTDGDTEGDACDPDDDGDGHTDAQDNCPLVRNADQANLDGDPLGDLCDLDDDGDGAPDLADNCPRHQNEGQGDTDGDTEGDACDPDDDGDGHTDAQDNCPLVRNADQANLDGDPFGDPCDADTDGDNVANSNDNCPEVGNPVQTDLDGDGRGNPCDLDVDGDGVPDVEDNCPLTENPDQADANGDAIGAACDLREDSDDGGGCSMTGHTTASPLWLVLGALTALRRRRRRR